MSEFLKSAKEQVLLGDGAMGTQIQIRDLDLESDFWGQENCSEILNLSRPDLVREIHKGYLEAGSDVIQTNSFGGSPITLDEFELGNRAYEINFAAAQIAREAADSFTDERQRFVLGSIGPGTKLPSLGHISYAEIERAIALQAKALVDGGIDAFLIETCQDPLQIQGCGQWRQSSYGSGPKTSHPGSDHHRDHRHDAGRHRHWCSDCDHSIA